MFNYNELHEKLNTIIKIRLINEKLCSTTNFLKTYQQLTETTINVEVNKYFCSSQTELPPH